MDCAFETLLAISVSWNRELIKIDIVSGQHNLLNRSGFDHDRVYALIFSGAVCGIQIRFRAAERHGKAAALGEQIAQDGVLTVPDMFKQARGVFLLLFQFGQNGSRFKFWIDLFLNMQYFTRMLRFF